MGNSLRASPLDIRAQYEKQFNDLQEAYGEAMLEIRALHEDLLAEGVKASIARLCT